MKKLKFNKFVTIATGDEYYALAADPQKKNIDGIEYLEVTPDFKRFHFIRVDSLKKIDSVMKTIV